MKGNEVRLETQGKGSFHLPPPIHAGYEPPAAKQDRAVHQPRAGNTGECAEPQKYQNWKEARRTSHSVSLILPQRALVLEIAFHGATDGVRGVESRDSPHDSNRSALFLYL